MPGPNPNQGSVGPIPYPVGSAEVCPPLLLKYCRKIDFLYRSQSPRLVTFMLKIVPFPDEVGPLLFYKFKEYMVVVVKWLLLRRSYQLKCIRTFIKLNV